MMVLVPFPSRLYFKSMSLTKKRVWIKNVLKIHLCINEVSRNMNHGWLVGCMQFYDAKSLWDMLCEDKVEMRTERLLNIENKIAMRYIIKTN